MLLKALLTSLLGCGAAGGGGGDAGADAPPCPSFLGDPASPPAAVVELRAQDGAALEVAQGDAAELVRPPQGGHVVFVGARATGVCGTGAMLRGFVLHGDGTIVALEGRTLDFAPIDAMPAWGRPDYAGIAGLANVPVCPNNTGRPLLGAPVRLRAAVIDAAGREAVSPEVEVALACRQEAEACRALCECECAEGYDLGEGCELPEGTACERFASP